MPGRAPSAPCLPLLILLLLLLKPFVGLGLVTADKIAAAEAGSLKRKRGSSCATSAKGSDILGRGLVETPSNGDKQRIRGASGAAAALLLLLLLLLLAPSLCGNTGAKVSSVIVSDKSELVLLCCAAGFAVAAVATAAAADAASHPSTGTLRTAAAAAAAVEGAMFLPNDTDTARDRRSLLPCLECSDTSIDACRDAAAAASMLCLHASLTWMVIGWPLLSMRLATFTVSPKKQ
jgi:hypothetical protein